MRTYVSPLQSAEGPKDVNKVMARFARVGVGVTSSVIRAAASSTCQASRDRVILSGKKRVKRGSRGVGTKAKSSLCQGLDREYESRAAQTCDAGGHTMAGIS